jgi:hypothetical protein
MLLQSQNDLVYLSVSTLAKIHFNKTVSLDRWATSVFIGENNFAYNNAETFNLQPLAVFVILQKYISTRSLCFGSYRAKVKLKTRHFRFPPDFRNFKTNFIKTVLYWNGFFFITKSVNCENCYY